MTAPPIASTSSSKYSTISSSSFLDLKGELSKQESTLFKSSSSNYTTGINSRKHGAAKKGGGIFSKQNRGTKGRDEKDRKQYEEDPGVDPGRARANLERKAEVYDKIRKGKMKGLTPSQIENLLVDFDEKDSFSDSSSSEEEEDESKTVPVRPLDSKSGQDLIEHTDEFGRTRLIPRRELPTPRAQLATNPSFTEGDPTAPDPFVPSFLLSSPQSLLTLPPSSWTIDSSNIRYGDQFSFPVYEPSPLEIAQRAAKFAEKDGPLMDHYNASRENRSKAAGFYAFSQNEEEREREMRNLKREREETERARDGSGSGELSERDLEKEERKRKLVEKRREMEEKREAKKRKVGDSEGL